MINCFKKRFTIHNYNIGLLDKSFLDKGIAPHSVVWLNHPYRDRFFADPFLWYQDDDNYYILAEELCFFEEFGRIVLLTADKESFSLKRREIMIEEPFHLSFPFCKEGDEWITPEAAKSKRCTQYRISKETHEILEKRVIADVGIIDPIFVEYEGEQLMLGSNSKSPLEEVYGYRLTKEGLYSLAKDEPLCKGRECARNAGAIFEHNGSLVRPVQICVSRYGEATAFRKIDHLSLEDYQETEIGRINSSENPPYTQTLHTVNVYDRMVLVDGGIDKFSLRYVFYRLRKWLNRKLKRRKK